MEVAKDKSEALVTYVQVRGMTNNKSRKLKAAGIRSKSNLSIRRNRRELFRRNSDERRISV